MPSALFRFFEVIADELSAKASRVITRENLRINDEESPLLDELRQEMEAGSSEEAVECAVEQLREHFGARVSNLPFAYERETGTFTARDSEFLAFVKDMSGIRSIGKRSRDFECTVAQRLGQRATGAIHRVGFPRDKKVTKAAFNEHLSMLGFQRPVLLGKEKDGGLDILWLLPIGAVPRRPIVSVQCKNGEFDLDAAHASVGAASCSLSQNTSLQQTVHVPCVLFNDYIYSEMLTSKPLNFVPLGLTDLATLDPKVVVELI
jgi:hypothetical protein